MLKIITYIIVSAVSAGLIIANVVVSGSLSTAGEELRELEQEKQQILEAKQELEAKILTFQSLSYLEKEAEARGFVRASEVIAFEVPENVVASR